MSLHQDPIHLGPTPHVMTSVAKAALAVRRAHPSAHVGFGRDLHVRPRRVFAHPHVRSERYPVQFHVGPGCVHAQPTAWVRA